MQKARRHNQAIRALEQFEMKYTFGPTASEVETFAQVRSRTLAKRFAELVKLGLLFRSVNTFKCKVSGRRAHRWYLTQSGRTQALVLEGRA